VEFLDQLVLHAAGSPWILLAVLAFTIIDGFFPPVPSESVVVGLAAVSVSTGQPSLLLLAIVAALGAMIGDNIAYQIGRRIGRSERGFSRFAFTRRPWFTRATTRASEALQRRVSTAVLAGRFIPGGRVAVNVTAGASGVPPAVFRPLTVLSGICWAAYSIIIGTVAGAWVREHPVLGALVAIGLGIVIGLLIDVVLGLLRRRRERRRPVREAEQPELEKLCT
jgi:membrane protein DedA with SNARE-associated domain